MRKRLFSALKVLFTGFLLVVIFSKIPFSDVANGYSDLDWTGVLWTFVLAIPNLGIQILRWRYLVRIVNPSVSNGTISASLFSGFSIGFVTPGRIGELSRGLFIENTSRAQLTGLVIIEKLISLWTLTVLGVAGFLYLRYHDRIFSVLLNDVFIVLAGILLVGLVIMILDPNLLRRWVRRSTVLVNKLPFKEKLLALVDASELFKKAHLPVIFFFSMIFQLIILGQIYMLLNAFDTASGLECFAAGSAAMLVKSMLPFTVMDLGVREGALIFFMGNIGIPAASALNASLMLFVVNVLCPSLIGYVLIARRTLRLK